MADDVRSGERFLDFPPPPEGEIPLHHLLGLEFDKPVPGEGTARVTMPVRRHSFGFTGNVHGGAIATMVDLACALAAVSATGFDASKESLVTADMHVRYVGRARTDLLVASASVVKVGGQLIVIDCDVTDSDDHLVAVADFSMMKVPARRPLSDDIAAVEAPEVAEPGPEL